MIALVIALALAAPIAKSKAPARPLDIRADHLTVLTKENRGVWKGHVHAIRPATADQPQLDLRCDQLVTDFVGEDKIQRVTCTGNVEVVQGDRMGWGDQAVYDSDHGELVVTGNPRGQQGPNKFRGDTLTFFVNEDRVEIERPTVDTPPPANVPGSTTASRDGASK
jgi:lipopolysaccharide export system protein LptA